MRRCAWSGELAELEVMEVTLTGGEAYLRDDWTRISRAVRDHGMTATMVTAARTLTADRAREACDGGIQAVSVSIDGLEASHDRLRGVAGSYRSAFEAIEHLRAQGIRVSCNTQIGRSNLRDAPDLLERLIDAGVRAWQLQLTVAMGRASDDPVLLIEPYQMLEVLPMVARLKKRADKASVQIWPADDIGYFGPYESLLRGRMPRGHLASCGAGQSCIGIEANGDVKGCLSLPTTGYVGGNVRDYPLRDIWERGVAMRFTRERSTSKASGATAGTATTPTPASPGARGRATCCSAGPATTPSAITAPWSSSRRASASGSSGSRPPAATGRSTTDSSRSWWRTGPRRSWPRRGEWPRRARAGCCRPDATISPLASTEHWSHLRRPPSSQRTPTPRPPSSPGKEGGA